MTIIVYELTEVLGYRERARIDESDGSVSGDSAFADYLEGILDEMRSNGFPPEDYMDEILERLRFNYGNYYVFGRK